MQKKQLKATLYEKCMAYADERLANIRSAINSAREGANNETKSSAGDKHETSRALMHFEQEKLSYQLTEAFSLKEALNKINVEIISEIASTGSLVITNQGNYYICISAGKIIIDDEIYFAVSPAAPIARALLGKKAKDEALFNGKSVKIEQLF